MDLCVAPQRQHHADRTAFAGKGGRKLNIETEVEFKDFFKTITSGHLRPILHPLGPDFGDAPDVTTEQYKLMAGAC